MIEEIQNLPEGMVGFKAMGEVTEVDFTSVVLPRVKELVERTGKLNYLLVLDTSVKNFTPGAWIQDALMGIKHLLKWNRCAIVTDVESIRNFTNMFSIVMPGEFRGFPQKELPSAINWVAGK